MQPFVDVRKVQEVGTRIVDPDADIGLVEDFADLVADGVVNPLHVEFGRQRLLHAIDDRQFRGALLALLEQTLSFVEQQGAL